MAHLTTRQTLIESLLWTRHQEYKNKWHVRLNFSIKYSHSTWHFFFVALITGLHFCPFSNMLNLVHGNVKWCSHYEKLYGSSSKTKIELAQDPAISFLGLYPKELKAGSWEDIYTPILIAALLITGKR